MATTWTRTITATTDPASTGMTRALLRESVVEQWLAEAGATFYDQGGTDNTLNMALDWSQRRLAQAMGGVDARWDVNTLITAPYEQALPRDMVWYEKATYNPNGPTGASVKELDQLTFDEMFSFFGREWIDDAAETPRIVVFRGFRTVRLYPPPATPSVTDGFSVFGRTVPAVFASDSAISVLPQTFDDGIATGAFVFALRRMSMQSGQPHPMLQEALQEWAGYLREAKAFSKNIPAAELVIAGTVSSLGRGRMIGRPLYDFEV